MPIMPLPQFEADLEQARRDAEEYARLSVPKTLVVRFGVMRLIGEYPYGGDVKPGCGTKVVVRTHRGTELGEMLTSTCPNAGCSKSVSRKEMLEYFENSGGRDYPFFTDGRVLRIATIDDLNHQSRLDAQRPALLRAARERARELGMPFKIVEAEPILGGERLTFYFLSEERADFRDLVTALSHDHATRIELRQVGARDEARLTADYEKCGQHCCCRQFLKVLKPVSIKAAKVQKASLDPLKISGRCGRLMCCLRYEDQTYDELGKRLPKLKKRVGTPHGVGVVIDRQVLTQLVLVRMESDGADIAVPVEDLCTPEEALARPAPDPLRGLTPAQAEARHAGRPGGDPQQAHRERSQQEAARGERRGAGPGEPPRGDRRGDRPAERPPQERPPGGGALAPTPEKKGGGPARGGKPGAPPRDPGAAPGRAGGAEPPRQDGKRRRRRRRKGGGPFGGGGGGPFGKGS